jgi:hypothetical protein
VRSDISKGGRRMVVAYNGGVCLATPAHACRQSSLQAAPAQTPLLRHAEAEVGGRRPRDEDDSSTARHQPLYRDQTVSKGKDTSISMR